MMHFSIYNTKNKIRPHSVVSLCRQNSPPVCQWLHGGEGSPGHGGGFMGVGTAQTFTHKKPASQQKNVLNDTKKRC